MKKILNVSIIFGLILFGSISIAPKLAHANQVPIGNLDEGDCSIFGGWAFDPDIPNSSITIRIYDGANLIYTGTTNGLRSDVNNAYGLTGNHGFTVSTPGSLGSLIDGANHTVHVYAVDNDSGGTNVEIGGSPKTVNCPAAQPTCTGTSHQADWTTANSGTLTSSAVGVANATQVLFPTWSDPNGQDDIVWYTGVQSGSTWTATINLANHPGLGNINVVAYMSNGSYTNVLCGGNNPFVRLNTGTIQVNSTDSNGNPVSSTWSVNCPLTNPNCPNIPTGGNATSSTNPNEPYSTWTITPTPVPGYDYEVTQCPNNPVNTPCSATFQ